MFIHRVALTNFKSFEEAVVDLPPGLTAIVGENGAGKSTILAAIGFGLFGFLPHTRLAHMRHGASRAAVSVEFSSARNGRRYRVTRTLRRSRSGGSGDLSRTVQGSAAVCDVASNRGLEGGVEEVGEFVARHLEMPSFASPADLFEHAVGVPQGRLTADFLDPPRLRQQRFDPVLQTAEFQTAFEALRGLAQHFAARNAAGQAKVAGLRGQLDRQPEMRRRLDDARQAAAAAAQERTTALAGAKSAEDEFQVHERLRTAASDTVRALDVARQLEAHARGALRAAVERVDQAARAARIVAAAAPGHAAHQAAHAALRDLRGVEARTAPLRETLAIQRHSLAASESDLRDARALLAGSEAAAPGAEPAGTASDGGLDLPSGVAALRDAHAAAQARAQARRSGAAAALARAKNEAVAAHRRLAGRVAALERAAQALRDALAVAVRSGEPAARLDALRDRLSELRARRANVDALFEADEHARDLLAHRGLCPFFDNACRNLAEIPDVTEIFGRRASASRRRLDELDGEIASTREKVAGAAAALEHAQRAGALGVRFAAERARLDALRGGLELLQPVLTAVRTDNRAALAKGLAAQASAAHAADSAPDLDAGAEGVWETASRVADALSALDDARADAAAPRIARAFAVAARRRLDADRAALTATEGELAAIQPDVVRLQAASREFGQTREASERYLRNVSLAGELDQRQAQVADARRTAGQAAEQLEAAAATHDRARQAFDPDAHAAALRARDDSLGRVRQLAEREAQARARVADLQAEHERLERIGRQLTEARAELARIRRAEGLTDFVRTVLRRAGPLVTEALLAGVSAAADEIFGVIMGDPSARLRWTSDYDIVLTRDGDERQFTQLSGGEQVSAALAVRLAVLREILKLDVAFFDEPTQHLDETRRANLAEQILNVRGFSQLVVITHDDTFERLLDGVIHVRKVAGRSVIEPA